MHFQFQRRFIKLGGDFNLESHDQRLFYVSCCSCSSSGRLWWGTQEGPTHWVERVGWRVVRGSLLSGQVWYKVGHSVVLWLELSLGQVGMVSAIRNTLVAFNTLSGVRPLLSFRLHDFIDHILIEGALQLFLDWHHATLWSVLMTRDNWASPCRIESLKLLLSYKCTCGQLTGAFNAFMVIIFREILGHPTIPFTQFMDMLLLFNWPLCFLLTEWLGVLILKHTFRKVLHHLWQEWDKLFSYRFDMMERELSVSFIIGWFCMIILMSGKLFICLYFGIYVPLLPCLSFCSHTFKNA